MPGRPSKALTWIKNRVGPRGPRFAIRTKDSTVRRSVLLAAIDAMPRESLNKALISVL